MQLVPQLVRATEVWGLQVALIGLHCPSIAHLDIPVDIAVSVHVLQCTQHGARKPLEVARLSCTASADLRVDTPADMTCQQT
jgi:hypothetical protein